MVSIREADPETSSHIRAPRFSTSLWGYRKEAVDAFVLQVAADYQLLQDATSEVAAAAKRDSGDVLEQAKEAADDLLHAAEALSKRIRHQAREESARVRADAAADAHAMTNDAIRTALEILTESEIDGDRAREYCDEIVRRVRREVVEMRSEAIDEMQTILHASHEEVRALSDEAEGHARELLHEAESEYRARLDRAQQLLTAIDAYERRVAARLPKMEALLERLTRLMAGYDSAPGGEGAEENLEPPAAEMRTLYARSTDANASAGSS